MASAVVGQVGPADVLRTIELRTPDLRLVAVGTTGNGKSTLLNRMARTVAGPLTPPDPFPVGHVPVAETLESSTRTFARGRLNVHLTDRPGFLDTGGQARNEDLARQVAEANRHVRFHAILFCLPLDAKLTTAEQENFRTLTTLYGGHALRSLVLVFTKGDTVDRTQWPERAAVLTRLCHSTLLAQGANATDAAPPAVVVDPQDETTYAAIFGVVAKLPYMTVEVRNQVGPTLEHKQISGHKGYYQTQCWYVRTWEERTVITFADPSRAPEYGIWESKNERRYQHTWTAGHGRNHCGQNHQM